MNCQHTKRIGDNYGITCQDCGQVLAGYGYGGWFGSNLRGSELCIHVWVTVGTAEEECQYCHTLRDKPKKAS